MSIIGARIRDMPQTSMLLQVLGCLPSKSKRNQKKLNKNGSTEVCKAYSNMTFAIPIPRYKYKTSQIAFDACKSEFSNIEIVIIF